MKLLMRCKIEFYTRNQLVEIFQEIMRYETHATMLKDLIEKQTSYRIQGQTLQFIQTEGALLCQSSDRILLNLKQLRAKVPSLRCVFMFR